MQRLVVQTYTDLDWHIGGKHKFCVRPSECFIFQPCGFLSLNPAPGLSKIGKPRDFHSFFQPWKLFVGFNISKPVVVWIIYSEQVCQPPFDSVQDLPGKRMDQVWEIMPFYDLLPTPIDNNVLNLLDHILIPSRYVSWGWLGFFVVIFRQSVKFSQYLRPWPSWQWHRYLWHWFGLQRRWQPIWDSTAKHLFLSDVNKWVAVVVYMYTKKCQYLIGHSRPACTATMRKFCLLWPPRQAINLPSQDIFCFSWARKWTCFCGVAICRQGKAWRLFLGKQVVCLESKWNPIFPKVWL